VVLKYKTIVVADGRYVITSNCNSTLADADATKKWKTRTKKKDPNDLKTLQDCHNLCKHIGGNTRDPTNPTISIHICIVILI
jgi:hypothetical protein